MNLQTNQEVRRDTGDHAITPRSDVQFLLYLLRLHAISHKQSIVEFG